jgi:hypothetical protein
MESGKVKFGISTAGFTNDFEKCPGGNLYRTVIPFLKCKTVEIKVYSIPCYEKTLKVTVVLQNCCNLLKVVAGSYSEICDAGVQDVNIKVKKFIEVEDKMSPVPITFPIIKAEHEVSCVCVCFIVYMSQISSIVCCLSHPHRGEWNLRSPFRNVKED